MSENPSVAAAPAAGVGAALADVVRMLSIDGYETSWSVHADELTVKIAAGPNACEECLSPKPVLERIIDDSLRRGGVTGLRVALGYPTDS
jgi:hypothetical protein